MRAGFGAMGQSHAAGGAKACRARGGAGGRYRFGGGRGRRASRGDDPRAARGRRLEVHRLGIGVGLELGVLCGVGVASHSSGRPLRRHGRSRKPIAAVRLSLKCRTRLASVAHRNACEQKLIWRRAPGGPTAAGSLRLQAQWRAARGAGGGDGGGRHEARRAAGTTVSTSRGTRRRRSPSVMAASRCEHSRTRARAGPLGQK